MVKSLPAMWETQVWTLGQEDPLEKKWQPTPVLLSRKSHGWRSLAGYSPWGHKESDMTERLLFPFLCYAKSLQSCLTLCDPIDGSPPGSLVPGILQARTLEWLAIFLLQCMKVKSEREVAQLCPTLSMDCSLPGSSIHGIFQARVLEWGAIAFSSFSLRELIDVLINNS